MSEDDIRDDGLTHAEGAVSDALIEAVNAYAKLERQHPSEDRDFCDAIHRCQDLLVFRIARRLYPKAWPIKPSEDTLESRISELEDRLQPQALAEAVTHYQIDQVARSGR
jgi:hypothetical protein